MAEKVLLIQHMQDGQDDRVARHLSRRGFVLEWRSPARGEALPRNHTDYAAVVVYGGIQSVNDAERLDFIGAEIDWIRRWVSADRAYLGLCLGGQLLARAMHARVAPHPGGLCEIGFVPVRPTALGRRFFPERLHVYQWHQEGFEIPEGGELLATGETYPNQAFRVGRRAFGLQFHPEATPRMRAEWLDASEHMLGMPGAHSRDRQEADARRFDAAMQAWLEALIDNHLLSPG